MANTHSTPRIYVASLSDYNAGRLHGCWIDAAQDVDEIHSEIQAMLSTSREFGAEEFAIHDFENFEGIRLSEFESIETVATLAELLEEHGPALAAFYANQPGYWAENLSELGDAFVEAFQGEFSSEADYAQELADGLGVMDNEQANGWPFTCIDWERAARDLFAGDYWSAYAGPALVYVFREI